LNIIIIIIILDDIIILESWLELEKILLFFLNKKIYFDNRR